MTSPTIASTLHNGLVLAVHPTTRGFGWVLFENAHTPAAWSIVHARRGRDDYSLLRFKRLLDRYEPRVFILESFEDDGTARSARIQALCRAMTKEAKARSLHTPVYDRDAIRLAFGRYGASTRLEIAKAITESIGDFAHRLPSRRRFGVCEDIRQSLFDAAALAITYFTAMGESE